jgi:hypothetical protein
MKNIVFSFIHKIMELGTIVVLIVLGTLKSRNNKMKSRFSKMILDFIFIKSLRGINEFRDVMNL